jgi:hypothetical protein
LTTTTPQSLYRRVALKALSPTPSADFSMLALTDGLVARPAQQMRAFALTVTMAWCSEVVTPARLRAISRWRASSQ